MLRFARNDDERRGALYPNLTAQLGDTWGSYVHKLDGDAVYLAGLGEPVTDVGQLFRFEVAQANGFSPVATLASSTDARVATPGLSLDFSRSFSPGILARNRFGRFGWGWSDSWETSLSARAAAPDCQACAPRRRPPPP